MKAKVYPNTQPINIDATINEMQNLFANNLSWLQYAYGRAWKAYSEEPGRITGKQYLYPAYYQGKKEYFNLMPNDNVKSMCFFATRDQMNPIEYLFHKPSEWYQELDIIFWFNYQAITQEVFGEKYDYPFLENLLGQVRKILNTYDWFEVRRIIYDVKNVYENYTANEIEGQYLVYPYGGFRINGRARYFETYEYGECAEYAPNIIT